MTLSFLRKIIKIFTIASEGKKKRILWLQTRCTGHMPIALLVGGFHFPSVHSYPANPNDVGIRRNRDDYVFVKRHYSTGWIAEWDH